MNELYAQHINHCMLKEKSLFITQIKDAPDIFEDISHHDEMVGGRDKEFSHLRHHAPSRMHNNFAFILFATSSLDRCGCTKKQVQDDHYFIFAPKKEDHKLIMAACHLFTWLGYGTLDDLIKIHGATTKNNTKSFTNDLILFSTLPHTLIALFFYDMDTLYPGLTIDEARKIYNESPCSIAVVCVWIEK